MGTSGQKRFTVLLMIGLLGSLGRFGAPTAGTDLLQAAEPTADGDWFQFLGPDRNGVSRESGLMKSWPTGGPKRVWQVAGGVGMSGMVISQGKLYTLVQREGKQWAVALEAATGKVQWQTALAAAYKNQMGDGPRATPVVSQGHLYVFTGEGILAALSISDGTVAWSQDTVKQHRGKIAAYGMVSSPLLVGDLVVVTVGAPTATVAAYERKSGKLAWTAGTTGTAGYSSAALLKLGGQQQVVVFGGKAALGIAPKTGKQLWTYPYVTDYDCNIATPLAHEGNLFLSAGENHGSVMLSLKPAADGFQLTEKWESQGAASVIRNEWQTSILLNGYLYGFDNVGSAGPVTHLTCVEAATGKRMWREIRFGKGNLLAADGKLFIVTMKGELVVVQATPTQYKELGRSVVMDRTRQTPALSHGHLFLRDDKNIICLDVRQR
jgi:outer membrane protein assembly factor BamB